MSALNPEEANEDTLEIDSDSDVNMSVFVDDTNEPNELKAKQEFVYEVLSIEQIVKQMQQCIEQVKAVIHLPSAVIRTLLKHFKWDTQKLLERLFDNKQEKLFKDVGIVWSNVNSGEGIRSKRRKINKNSKIANCKICYIEMNLKQMFSLDCGHLFCKSCWNQYLTSKIMSEGIVNAMTCAETDCKIIVNDEQVLQLLDNVSVKAKYQRLTTNSYVESNRLLRWCPKPDCMYAFSVKFSEPHLVVCVCGTQICFACGQTNHQPIECDLLREWNRQCAGNNNQQIDGKTANWIITNTKECPKCGAIIEKNGGCNHM